MLQLIHDMGKNSTLCANFCCVQFDMLYWLFHSFMPKSIYVAFRRCKYVICADSPLTLGHLFISLCSKTHRKELSHENKQWSVLLSKTCIAHLVHLHCIFLQQGHGQNYWGKVGQKCCNRQKSWACMHVQPSIAPIYIQIGAMLVVKDHAV